VAKSSYPGMLCVSLTCPSLSTKVRRGGTDAAAHIRSHENHRKEETAKGKRKVVGNQQDGGAQVWR